MSFNHHNANDEIRQAEELDEVLTAQQMGRSQPIPNDLPSSKVDLANKLVAHVQAIHPDPGFAASLEADLLQRQSLLIAQTHSTDKSEHLGVQPGVEPAKVLPAIQALPNSPSLSKRGHRSMRFTNPFRSAQQVSLVALALLVVTSVVTISTPSLRSLALEFIQVFQRTRSDQVGHSSEATQPSVTEDELQAAENQVRTTTTVKEMEIERGVSLKEPIYIPDGYNLAEVGSPYPEVVASNYENTRTGNRFFVIQQRLDGDSPVVGPIVLIPPEGNRDQYNFMVMWSKQPLFDDDPALAGGSPIGASARTTPIQVGDVVGEYVEGTWQELMSCTEAVQGMRWVHDTNFRQIQWREGDILFQVFSPNAMNVDELAAIARSLQ